MEVLCFAVHIFTIILRFAVHVFTIIFALG
jgi:hypothetical protein